MLGNLNNLSTKYRRRKRRKRKKKISKGKMKRSNGNLKKNKRKEHLVWTGKNQKTMSIWLRTKKRRHQTLHTTALQRRKERLTSTKQESVVRAKVPKMVLSKFNGTQLYWFWFWNQFQVVIDGNATISSITKFSYLKQLTVLSVHVPIEGL